MTTPIEEWKVTKDPRGTYPRMTTYTVDPIDGEYTFTVMLERNALTGDKATCFVDGAGCDHAKAVTAALGKKK